jgi:DNA polymerase-3 subunit beta
MKIVIPRDQLLATLNHLQSVVEKRNAIPILSNVKIEASADGTVTMTTTDMDIAIIESLKAVVKEEGIITIPAITLYEIVRKIPNNEDISLSQDKKNNTSVSISVNSSEFTLPALPHDEFPNFEVSKSTHEFEINSEVLKTLLSKTKHAISNEETRYYLNGIYLHPATNEDNVPVIRAVATDGHRLARAQSILPENAQDMPGIIIPKKTVNELIKLLEDFVGEVHISLSQQKITFDIGSSKLISKLIDGKFPDYERVIPKNNDKTLEIDRAVLARSIDLVISISNDKTRAVKFNIDPGKVTVTATSEVNGNSRGVQELPANYSSNEVINIGFNSRYVLDSLAAIEGDTVKMSLSNNLGAVIAQDSNESNCLYILMPMQI